MSSNFECIGMPFQDDQEFALTMDGILGASRRVRGLPARFDHRLWVDASGAAVAIHVEGNAVACLTPFFDPPDGLMRWRVSTSAPTLDECDHCGGADCNLLSPEGEMVTRATLQWLFFAPYRDWLSQPRTFEIEVVAFAHRARFFADEAAFDEAQGAELGQNPLPSTGTPFRLAVESFIPIGMFEPPGNNARRATATFAGSVVRVDRLRNSRTGGAFSRVRVRTLPGETDVVVGGSDTHGLKVGAIAWIDAWLVGRPVPVPFPV
ncbi:MAG: hypothetical protein IRZ16_13775 [Myxococcaceae bacterium]|nr:hypothetical protein [Myxococcaceae bacterium]